MEALGPGWGGCGNWRSWGFSGHASLGLGSWSRDLFPATKGDFLCWDPEPGWAWATQPQGSGLAGGGGDILDDSGGDGSLSLEPRPASRPAPGWLCPWMARHQGGSSGRLPCRVSQVRRSQPLSWRPLGPKSCVIGRQRREAHSPGTDPGAGGGAQRTGTGNGRPCPRRPTAGEPPRGRLPGPRGRRRRRWYRGEASAGPTRSPASAPGGGGVWLVPPGRGSAPGLRGGEGARSGLAGGAGRGGGDL